MQNSIHELMIKPGEIDFAPQTELEEILQNVLTICTTIKGSVPMDRELGLDGGLIDDPVNSVRAKYIQEVVKAVRKYEPRARVSRVEFTGDMDGKIYPKLFIITRK